MVRFRYTYLFVTGLYVLAAARAVVPGLCQTQAAVAERLEARGCCAERCAPEKPSPEGAEEVSSPSRPPCAFCLLAAAPTEPLTNVSPGRTPGQPLYTFLFAPLSPVDAELVSRAFGRSPPYC